mgnify:CR=1 FL=1
MVNPCTRHNHCKILFKIDNMMVIQSAIQFYPQLSIYEHTCWEEHWSVLHLEYFHMCIQIKNYQFSTCHNRPSCSMYGKSHNLKIQLENWTWLWSSNETMSTYCTNSFPLRKARVNASQILPKRECLLTFFVWL